MQRQNYLYHTVYRITNLLDGKIYIGAHSTSNLDDGYMGSGKHLRRAYKTHGIENFKKEILFIYDTLEEAFNKEAEIVTEEFVKDNSNYNIALGGVRPSRGFLGGKHTDKAKKAISESHSGKNNPFYGKKHTEEHKKHISKLNTGSNSPSYGIQLTEDRKEKIKKSKTGLVWWNNGIISVQNKTCPSDGFIRGRIINGRKKETVWNNGTSLVISKVRPGFEWKAGYGPLKKPKWYLWNNGKKIIQATECPGPEWSRGIGNLRNKSSSSYNTNGGKICYNNGIVNKFSKDHPGDGWVIGRKS